MSVNVVPQESIRASKDWFMACAPHAAGMAAMMGERLPKAGSYDDQLHVIYLANDILLKGCVHLHAPALFTSRACAPPSRRLHLLDLFIRGQFGC